MTGKRIVAIAIAVIGTEIVRPGITINVIRTMTSGTEIGGTNIRAEEAVVTAGMTSAIDGISTIDSIRKIATAVEIVTAAAIARIREIAIETATIEDLRLATGRESPAKINREEGLAREANLQL